MNLCSSRTGGLVSFSSKRNAAAWLKEQGFARLVGATGQGGGWICGGRQARWVPLPDQKPAGVVVLSSLRGSEVGYDD